MILQWNSYMLPAEQSRRNQSPVKHRELKNNVAAEEV